MQHTKHKTITQITKQVGIIPSYWSAIDCINREPGVGSMEDRVN